jgi:hypothetical protein
VHITRSNVELNSTRIPFYSIMFNVELNLTTILLFTTMPNVGLNSTTVPLYQVKYRVGIDKNSVLPGPMSSSNRHVILQCFVLGFLSFYYLMADYKLGI